MDAMTWLIVISCLAVAAVVMHQVFDWLERGDARRHASD